MRRARLFAGERGGLEPVRRGDRAFITISSHGFDPVERRDGKAAPAEVLRLCVSCHHRFGPDPEIPVQSQATLSILSLPGLLKPQTLDTATAGLVLTSHPAVRYKQRRADWGMLRAYWAMD